MTPAEHLAVTRALNAEMMKAVDGGWFSIRATGVRLDGDFTPAQLRQIADIFERYPKDEE